MGKWILEIFGLVYFLCGFSLAMGLAPNSVSAVPAMLTGTALGLVGWRIRRLEERLTQPQGGPGGRGGA